MYWGRPLPAFSYSVFPCRVVSSRSGPSLSLGSPVSKGNTGKGKGQAGARGNNRGGPQPACCPPHPNSAKHDPEGFFFAF